MNGPDLEVISSRLSPAEDSEEDTVLYKQGSQLYNVSLDCIPSNRSSWNLIMCEERAGRFIQNVEQPGYMKIWRIILADGSSGSLREEKVTIIRVVDAQEINRLNGEKKIGFRCSVEKAMTSILMSCRCSEREKEMSNRISWEEWSLF